MSLDNRQKRGAAMLISQPYRPWLADPDGAMDVSARLSILKLGLAEAFVAGPPGGSSPLIYSGISRPIYQLIGNPRVQG